MGKERKDAWLACKMCCGPGISVLPEIHLPFLAQTFFSARKWETALSSCKTGGKSQTKGTLLHQQLREVLKRLYRMAGALHSKKESLAPKFQ